MRIEPAKPTDLDAVVALLTSQFDEHRIDLERQELRDAVAGLLADVSRGAALIARDPDPIGVAVLAYTWTLEHGGRVAWLDELFVVAEGRARGVGRALLVEAIEVARRAGCRAVELEVDVEHERAEHLYEREGFAPLSRRRWAKRLL
jgi:GNAT superfamily N-acetyltransferase